MTKQSPAGVFIIPSPDKADNGDPCWRLAQPLELSSDIWSPDTTGRYSFKAWCISQTFNTPKSYRLLTNFRNFPERNKQKAIPFDWNSLPWQYLTQYLPVLGTGRRERITGTGALDNDNGGGTGGHQGRWWGQSGYCGENGRNMTPTLPVTSLPRPLGCLKTHFPGVQAALFFWTLICDKYVDGWRIRVWVLELW